MPKIIYCTFFTESHTQLYTEWFKPSFDKYHPNSELVVRRVKQFCKSGRYLSDGWKNTMYGKIKLISDCLNKCSDGDFICYMDCDIQFFNNIFAGLSLSEIIPGTIACQMDNMSYACAGFIFMPVCAATTEFINKWYHTLHKDDAKCDQKVFNQMLLAPNCNIKLIPLGPEFYSVWRDTNKQLWNNHALNPPENIIMHHATYIMGVDDKIRLLASVRDLVLARLSV